MKTRTFKFEKPQLHGKTILKIVNTGASYFINTIIIVHLDGKHSYKENVEEWAKGPRKSVAEVPIKIASMGAIIELQSSVDDLEKIHIKPE